jgi:hypothetical protein
MKKVVPSKLGDKRPWLQLELSKKISADPKVRKAFSLVMFAIIEYLKPAPETDDTHFDKMFDSLRSSMNEFLHQEDLQEAEQVYQNTLRYLARWYVFKKGDELGSTYSKTNEFLSALLEVLKEKFSGRDVSAAIFSFRKLMFTLHSRDTEPYAGCNKICKNKMNDLICLYRYNVQEHINAKGGYEENLSIWKEFPDGKSAIQAAEKISELMFPGSQDEKEKRKRAFCYAIQMDKNAGTENMEKFLVN